MALNFPNEPEDGEIYEGFKWNATVGAWQSLRSGGTGNVASDSIQPNFNTISENYEFPAGFNGVSAGPITIADGFTVTVPDGSAWSIV
jgi:hypothetical protein